MPTAMHRNLADADEFLRCVQEELPYRPTTGFRYEVLTDDPVVRKQVDDMIHFYGEEAPCLAGRNTSLDPSRA